MIELLYFFLPYFVIGSIVGVWAIRQPEYKVKEEGTDEVRYLLYPGRKKKTEKFLISLFYWWLLPISYLIDKFGDVE